MLYLENVTRFMRELLIVLKDINLEEDAHWVFRIKTHEIVAWSDQDEKRPPDIFWTRAERGPVGKMFFLVSNGVGTITNMTFKDVD